jgi:hypothetical protein
MECGRFIAADAVVEVLLVAGGFGRAECGGATRAVGEGRVMRTSVASNSASAAPPQTKAAMNRAHSAAQATLTIARDSKIALLVGLRRWGEKYVNV